MATRSTIWATFEDGSVKGVYCHNDGYLSYNGEILIRRYASQPLAEKLVSLGALSTLDENPDPLELAAPKRPWMVGDIPADKHSFNSPQKGVVIAYHRDRNEPFMQHQGIDGKPDQEAFEQFNYWWFDGAWHIHKGNDEWAVLTKEYIEEDSLVDEEE